MNTVRYVRVQQEDGSYSTSIPIGADAENITLKNGIDAELTFGLLKDQAAALTSRVDGFTHLAEGSTTGDAELLDIRNGVDGTKYQSAGTAVRAQVNKITRAKAFINDDDLLEIKNYRLDNTLDDIDPLSLDPSLQVSGAAADAKATGDAIKMANTNISAIDDDIILINNNIRQLTQSLDGKVDEILLSEDRKYIVFKSNGSTLALVGPIAGEGGGGGGGGGSTTQTVMTMSNNSGWLVKTIAENTSLSVSCNWSSTLDDIPTGSGILKIYIGGVVRSTRNVLQGNFTVDVTNFLSSGTNSVRINVTDVYGTTRDIRYTITVLKLKILSSFDYKTPVSGEFTFFYVPSGDLEKTIHFKVDNTELPTETVATSGRQQSKIIPAQTHGSHILDVWFTAEVDGAEIESNHLRYDFMRVDSSSTLPIISSQFNTSTVEQYQTIVIPYQVYDPAGLTSSINLIVDGTTIQTITVDRTEQQWSYRPVSYGNKVFKIKCGSTEKIFNLTVTESPAKIGAVTLDLSLYLNAVGRSNGEDPSARAQWSYQNISATLSNFNFRRDGWQLDSDGITVLRVSGDARVTIPYKIFAEDFRTTGKTIEIEFATRDVMNYDTPILSCLSGGRGIVATSQKISMASEQVSLETQFKEDEHVRISFVVEKRSDRNRLMYCYINGVLSAVTQYPDDDDFSQINPVNISIGTNDAIIDIYNIRIYDNALTRYQILGNWIADTADATLMLERYDRNNIFDNNSNIVIEKLPNDLPYMIISCPELPQYKGDKRTCSITYIDPANPTKNFTNDNVQIDVQGTSSQYYPRKNYKIKGKGKYVNSLGEESSMYQLTDECLPANVFCLKADFASSEGANNVELVRAYCQACPYETPAQEDDPLVRQGIDGFPCVIFWNDGTSVQFIGKYNFNLDKGAENCFGFEEGDESWEIKTHASSRVLWKVSDFAGTGWLDDFEARYPDTDPPYQDPTQLKAFSDWICQTDTEAATGNALPASVTYNGTTYTTDTAAYRLAKFKAEIGNYVEEDSMLFYYLFTELFLMVDSRSKNMFPSFMGSEVIG